MRSKNGELTPREAAISILCGWAEAAAKNLTTDLDNLDDRESYREQVKSALLKERDKLAARVNCID